MTIDFWGLGLQAVNVLILVWLLSRVFWRPVAGAIAARQEATQAVIDGAAATQARAEAALAEVTQARDGIAAERAAILEQARAEAEAASKASADAARARVEAMKEAAKASIARDTEAARKADAARATELSLDIAAQLLGRLNGPAVQASFLSQLVEAIAAMPAAERAALAAEPGGVAIVTAADPGPEAEAIRIAVRDALGGDPALRFITDPALIAGIELRSPHFALHNSWQADLAQVRKAVHDGA